MRWGWNWDLDNTCQRGEQLAYNFYLKSPVGQHLRDVARLNDLVVGHYMSAPTIYLKKVTIKDFH